MKSKRLILATALVAVCGISGAGSAEMDDDPLNQTVTFDGAMLSLKELAVKVGSVTGVEIEVPKHLLRRRVSVAASGQSARSVLDAVCELEGWTWGRQGNSKVVRIEGPVAGVRPAETTFAALRRLHPPDLVNYLRLPPATTVGMGSGDPGQIADRREDVSKRLWLALSPREAKLKDKGVTLAELKPDEAELVVLTVLLSHQAQRTYEEFGSNSNYLTSRSEATRLRIDQGSVLLVDCDLGMGKGSWSFGANTARNP